MADLTDLTAPQQGAPAGGGLSDLATPQPSQQATTATPPPPPAGDLSDLSGPPPAQPMTGLGRVINDYLADVKRRNPQGIMQGMDQRIKWAQSGINRYFDRMALTAEVVARDVDQSAGLYKNGHPLDKHIAANQQAIAAINKASEDNPEAAGNVDVGGDLGSLLTYMGLHKGAQMLGPLEYLEKIGPVAKVLKNSPLATRILTDLIEHGATGAVQAKLEGQSNTDAALAGLISGGTGALLGGGPNAARGQALKVAGEVAPIERTDVKGAPFVQMAGEQLGPSGEKLAPVRAQNLMEGGLPEKLRPARETAMKQLQTNLAQEGLQNHLNDANTGMSESGVSPDIKQSANATWRYYPPGGKTSLSPQETQSALNDLKTLWLSQDWSPREDSRIRQAYNDMQEQFNRHQDYVVQQPANTPHDVAGTVSGTNSYEDAANYLKTSARKALQMMDPADRATFMDTENQLQKAQNRFNSTINPDEKAAAEAEINDLHQKQEDLFSGSVKSGSSAPEQMAQSFKDLKMSNVFQRLQNTMDKYFTLRQGTAARIQRPRVTRNLEGLSDDIEQIRKQYGDVLNNTIGPKGLDHIIELGDLLKDKNTSNHADGILNSIQTVMRRHFTGLRGMTHSGGAALGYILGHGLLGGVGGGAAAIGADYIYTKLVRELGTNPDFNRRFQYAVKQRIPARIAGVALAAAGTKQAVQSPNRTTQTERELENADGTNGK